MSYLDNALIAPTNHFRSAVGNEVANFFTTRAKFLVAIAEKVVNLVASLFKLILVDSIPAIVNYTDGRVKAKATGWDILNSLRDIPVGITGLIFGIAAANGAKAVFYGEIKKVEVKVEVTKEDTAPLPA
jgi:hypothetical protein